MNTVTLKYTDPTAGVMSRTFYVLSVSGLDYPDSTIQWPAAQKSLLDGSTTEMMLAFRRVITIDFGVLPDLSDQGWLVGFCMGRNKIVENPDTMEDISVVLYGDTLQSIWLSDLEDIKKFAVKLKEAAVLTAAPSSWS